MKQDKPLFEGFFSEKNMKERLSFQYRESENADFITWQFNSCGSVYTVAAIDNNRVLVGGSLWQRKFVPFSEDSRAQQGVVQAVGGQEWHPETIKFSSMVNSVLPFRDRYIVCCKYGEQAYNVIGQDLQVQKTADDSRGNGVYNALITNEEELVSAVRNGGLSFRNPFTLELIDYVSLSGNVRLWSVAQLPEGRLVAGDYAGMIYIVKDGKLESVFNLGNQSRQEVPEFQQRFEPSVFGLSVSDAGNVAAAVRWGGIYWFNREMELERSLIIPHEISTVGYVPESEDLLIGTRSGSLLHLRDLDNEIMLTRLLSIKPALQNDNSIWSISFDLDKRPIVAFADGQVIKINQLAQRD